MAKNFSRSYVDRPGDSSVLEVGSVDSDVAGGIDWVSRWQELANKLFRIEGHVLRLELDGKYGPFTEQATCEVQQLLGVPVTGIVDGNLWAECYVRTI